MKRVVNPDEYFDALRDGVSRHDLKVIGFRTQRLRAARLKGRHTPEEWARLLEFCGHRCSKCGDDERLCKDHIVTLYQGGSDAIENLQPLCHRCNSAKHWDSTDYRPVGWQEVV